MFGDLDWPLKASRGLSAIAEFLVNDLCGHTVLVRAYSAYRYFVTARNAFLYQRPM